MNTHSKTTNGSSSIQFNEMADIALQMRGEHFLTSAVWFSHNHVNGRVLWQKACRGIR